VCEREEKYRSTEKGKIYEGIIIMEEREKLDRNKERESGRDKTRGYQMGGSEKRRREREREKGGVRGRGKKGREREVE
jgi:hypothetical protein